MFKPEHPGMNPWGLLGINPSQHGPRNAKMQRHIKGLHPMAMGQPPLGSFHPQSTFFPGTGEGWAHQSHPYNDTNKKKEQKERDLSTPWRAFPQESLNGS